MNTRTGRRILSLFISLLLFSLTLIPALGSAESLYIIPDSDRRELTEAELWNYRYDTLLYAFNEIYARHGYKFETGSRCYNWFTLMPWYHANESENSKNHHETYSQCSTIENRNVDLIKKVRADMRAAGTTNPKGIGMPTPPAQNIDTPRGFNYVSLKTGQKLAVYTAPSSSSYRANKGKAAVSTNGAVYALGWDGNWMLMLYEANFAGQYRIGYIDGSKLKGTRPSLSQLRWDGSSCQVLQNVSLTDDPALTGNSLAYLPSGTWVTYLSTMYNSDAWDYIETTIDGKQARGFIPSGLLSNTGVDMTEDDSEG